jgi:hypothetical protein
MSFQYLWNKNVLSYIVKISLKAWYTKLTKNVIFMLNQWILHDILMKKRYNCVKCKITYEYDINEYFINIFI